MNSVLSALRREEKKSLKMINEAEQQLATVRAAIKLMGGSGKTGKKTRRRMSAATRKKMAASAKKRWAAKKAQ